MTALVNKSCNWIRTHFPKDRVNKLSVIVIMVYYYLGLLSYITVPIKPIYRLFTSGSSVALIIRAVMTAIMCLYCLLVIIVNREHKIQWKWMIVFIYILLFTLLSAALSPQTYNYIYVSQGNYNVVYWVQASTGFNRLFTMYLSSISDFALAFCFLFILPIVFNNKKQLLILLLPIVFIGLFECCYSIIKEREEYIKLINMVDPQYGGYNIGIGATFGNKEDWGAFATVAFVSTIGSIFCLDSKKKVNVLFKILLSLASFVIFVFSCMSLCKTAIGAQVFCLIILLVYLFFVFYKKNKKLFICYCCLVTFLLLLIVVFLSVQPLQSIGFLGKIYKIINAYIISPIFGGAASGRTEIWMRFVNKLRTYNMFFGLSKGGVSTYSQVVTIEGQSAIHNGFAYFFGSYGIFGFSIYVILLGLILYRIVKLRKTCNTSVVFLSLCAFVSAMVFSLAESEVLLISGSNPIYIFNILVCVLPQGLLLKNTKEDGGLLNA